MNPETLAVDLKKLQEVVQSAVGSISQGATDHFMLRAVARADYNEDDVLMAALTSGASEGCFAVELIDAYKGDTRAVKVQGVSHSQQSFRRWAGMLWRAWEKTQIHAAA